MWHNQKSPLLLGACNRIIPLGSSLAASYRVKHAVLHLVAHSCPTLCDPMDCSPPGSSVYGILQARILEWVAVPSSRGSSQPREEEPCYVFYLPIVTTELRGKQISASLISCTWIKHLFTWLESRDPSSQQKLWKVYQSDRTKIQHKFRKLVILIFRSEDVTRVSCSWRCKPQAFAVFLSSMWDKLLYKLLSVGTTGSRNGKIHFPLFD